MKTLPQHTKREGKSKPMKVPRQAYEDSSQVLACFFLPRASWSAEDAVSSQALAVVGWVGSDWLKTYGHVALTPLTAGSYVL